MQCPQCGKQWPDTYKVCPECVLPLIAAGEGAVVTGDIAAPVATAGGIAAQGHVIIAGDGARVVIGEEPVETPALDRDSVLARYLRHVIARNRYLALQGIRSGGKLVSIELEQIYITLRTTRQRTIQAEERWLEVETGLAPGEMQLRQDFDQSRTETVTVSVNEALAAEKRLVVLGDPGSGKTTLLRYLALLYARDVAEQGGQVQSRLSLTEDGRLPILIPLRKLGAYLKAHRPADDGAEGHALLLQHLHAMLQAERIDLATDFFDRYLESGQAVILLDGLDEIADPESRRRVSRMVEAFTAAYPTCRYVVTSRIVGYTGAARLGEDYVTTTVRDFTDADVAQFLRNWHLAVAVGQMGAVESAQTYAEGQTQQLLAAIRDNERIRELAINPLLLTVIALVHRDRVKLPDRRAELYAEAVDVLLGKWDEAKGTQEVSILPDRPFDIGDKRLLLYEVALAMHEKEQKEIAAEDLRCLLAANFKGWLPNGQDVSRVVDRFLQVVEERTGLLVARGEGVYGFSHLTFQEYLAALAVAGRDDYVVYTLQHCGDPWWREVVLLEAGHLSMQSRAKATSLIQAIVDCDNEPEPYHNLVLAAECLRDVGAGRVAGDLEGEVRRRLRAELETPAPKGWLGLLQLRLRRGISAEELTRRRVAAAQALARIGGMRYWTLPYGEPEWVEIPAGPFWMGDGAKMHQVTLASFLISRVPVTNAQYQLFVKATGNTSPRGWEGERPPKDKENHPVVNVSWDEALAYCAWLSQAIGKHITLPSEAEWEKAARGHQDKRDYPWGNTFDATRCNSAELGLGDTTPVGIFPDGASPYGVLDMAGNVWEWTSTESGSYRVLRGGAFLIVSRDVRCAFRLGDYPDFRRYDFGFRVVASPSALCSG